VTPQDFANHKVSSYRHGLDLLNTTKWQDFAPKSAQPGLGETTRYLNLTGFRQEDDFAWEKLDAFKKRSEEFGAEAKKLWQVGKDEKVGLEGMIYENATGIVKGKWVRNKEDLLRQGRAHHLNLTAIAGDVDWAYYSSAMWTRNITGPEGNLRLRIEKDKKAEEDHTQPDLGPSDLTSTITAQMTIQDETSSGNGWETQLHGIHWPRQGVIWMTTTSDKFAGIFGLPHLTNDKEYFRTSQKRLNITLPKTIEKLEAVMWRDVYNPWSATPNDRDDSIMPIPHCEFVVFAQIQPLQMDHSHDAYFGSPNVVDLIENELRNPQGAPIPQVPKLEMSTVIFSPDCGFMLESKGPPAYSPKEAHHLVGKKEQYWLNGLHTWLNTYAFVILLQLFLLKAQSKEASTPSTIGRVSLYSVVMLLMADGLIFASMSFLSVLAPFLFPSAVLLSFTGLLSVGMGIRFVAAVFNVQEPERRARLREQATREATVRQNTVSAPTVVVTAAGADTAVPQRNQSPPILVPSDQDVDAEIAEALNNAAPTPVPTLPTVTRRPTAISAEPPQTFGAIYAKFVMTLTIILFISLSASSWPVWWRSGYVNLLCFTYLSFWWPQIYRNVVRNCRKALLWKFVIGQSILRMLPIAYFYLVEENIIFGETDWKSFTVLAGWLWIQVWLLVGQEVLGPRWGLPKTWYTEGWDYHPILREDNVEAGGLPIGLVQAPSSPTISRANTGEEEFAVRKKKDSSMREVDCAICMAILEVPVIAAGDEASSVAGLMARRLYMVTPCRHVFHSTCLEGWMKFRLQCPICRENLPPL